ncbi:hypothetical protein [Nitrosospira briensis]|uniref:hypothetical protein n=1 Tax=Nitrosospira briensis TaxID=35799 RepID=UPI0015A71AA5|nr:hypothetical protein [Nitrosospira briensis]
MAKKKPGIVKAAYGEAKQIAEGLELGFGFGIHKLNHDFRFRLRRASEDDSYQFKSRSLVLQIGLMTEISSVSGSPAPAGSNP